MTIQISVQKVHRGRRCTHDTLAKIVSYSWNNSLSVITFRNVHVLLRVVLVFVVDGKRSNEFVKKKRGKSFRDYTLPNDEIGYDRSVAMHSINTTAIKARDVEQDDDIYDL